MIKRLEPLFALDETVSVKGRAGRGYIGTILAIEGLRCGASSPEYRYLLDCLPGAMGNYIWIRIRNNKAYCPDALYAANWFNESQLTKLKKTTKRKPRIKKN